MLPVLKNRQEGSLSEPAEPLVRGSDYGEEEFDMLDAIAEDLIDAIHNKDRELVRFALEVFWDHIKEQDQLQDQQEKVGIS